MHILTNPSDTGVLVTRIDGSVAVLIPKRRLFGQRAAAANLLAKVAGKRDVAQAEVVTIMGNPAESGRSIDGQIVPRMGYLRRIK